MPYYVNYCYLNSSNIGFIIAPNITKTTLYMIKPTNNNTIAPIIFFKFRIGNGI